ncbi:MAG: hypothetical protein KBS85_02895 [Lachnospiraceae bacterium]|nr:hypothetical protein [Candidatus Merdinaster equi]
MSSHLIKSYRTSTKNDDEPVVIDTNELIAKKIEAQRSRQNAGFQSFGADGYSPEDLSGEGMDALFADQDGEYAEGAYEGDGYGEYVEGQEGFSEGLSGNVIKANPVPMQPVYDGPSPEELIAQAQEEIEAMRQAAQAEIEELRSQVEQSAYDQGMMNGYQEGKEKAMREVDVMKDELARRAEVLETEYQQKIAELEPAFIDMLTPIYEHVIGAKLESEVDAIKMLIANTMRGIEGCRTFLLHVSAADYPDIQTAKKELADSTGLDNVSVEVVADGTLSQTECTIETENGIYDCSLGTQLAGLKKQLKILAYSVR